MAIRITSGYVGMVLIESGEGIPVHVSTLGTLYLDRNTGLYYRNSGINIWSGISGSQLTTNELAAIQSSNNPSASNPFATLSDLSASTTPVIGFVHLSGDTMTGNLVTPSLSATSISGVTLFSGSTNLSDLFATQTQLNTRANLSGATFTGNIITPSLSATTISATTLYGNGSNLIGIPDTFVTGGTYSSGSTIFRNNTGGTFTITGFTTGSTISRSFGLVIDGGGSSITSGIKSDVIIPYNMTISDWTIIADQTGSIIVDLWKTNYASFPPISANTITGSQSPRITSGTKNTSTSLSGWTTSISAGDIIRFSVVSATTLTKITLSIKGVS